uniref:Uncharacterized protein n=1 Tax=Leersia perrieri TaxID=77586 RepID=A0A0D9WCG4_9ORYZ
MLPAAGVVPRGCGGDRCAFGRDAWPLHNVRHQGIFCRLCSSCVLLYHPSSFCSSCLLLLPQIPQSSAAAAGVDQVVAAPGPVSACSSCGLFVAHHSCVSDPLSFLCPTCAAAAHGTVFSYLPPGGGGGGARRVTLDERGARVLLVAARLSHESISRAAAAAREEAERRVRDAVVARRQAKEMKKKAPKSGGGEAGKDRDRLLKLNAMKKPALAFAAAAAAAASSMPLSMPSPMEEDSKPVVVTEEMQDSGDGSLSYERGPLFGTLQS